MSFIDFYELLDQRERSARRRLQRRLKWTALVTLLLLVAGCSASISSKPLPQGSTPAASASAAAGAVSPRRPVVQASTQPSSCDVARESFLTGTPAEVESALKALRSDKTAPAVAREYAGYWLTRDAKQPQLREMDQTLIASACA